MKANTKRDNASLRKSKRSSTNSTKALDKTVDTNRRYTKKELDAMSKEDLTLLAYRMTYDRVHGKRKVRD